jgi:hypothetical protein
MISTEILILTILAAVFITGASFGQLLLRIRLAKMEKMNLDIEQKRIVDLKKAINHHREAPPHQVRAGSPGRNRRNPRRHRKLLIASLLPHPGRAAHRRGFLFSTIAPIPF